MKYSEFALKCRPGDLIAVSHQEWKTLADVESQLVRVATESEYSHVAVVIDSGDGVYPYLVEAIVPHVTVSPVEKYLGDGFYWIHIPDKPMADAERAYALEHCGDGYSKLEAVEGFFNMLDIAEDKLWQCSELTISMRRMSGLDLGPKATPAAVVQSALQQGYTLAFVSKD